LTIGHSPQTLDVVRRWLAAAAVAVLLGVAFRFAGRVLVVEDRLPISADAIVVLAGSIPDRALEAADLYREGVAPRVIVTRERLRRGELALRSRGVRLVESDEETRRTLRALGVPADAVRRLGSRNRSTATEAATIARWACARRLRALVVVTSRAHTRRARLILRRTLEPAVAVAVRPSRHDDFDAGRWWRDRRDAKTVLGEYEKLAHYWLRERWTIRPCGGGSFTPAARRPLPG
jgi:uncharacterized SAM-binding protein YcdF (DUF218 family)